MLIDRPFFRACPGAQCSLFCSRAHKICWQRARFALWILAGYFLPQPLCYFLFSRTCFPFRSFFKWQPDGRQITIEWVILKVKIYFKDSNLCPENITIITWKEVNRCYNPDLPNLLPPVNVVLTILSTSADCEREFGKTDQNWALSFAASICFRQWWCTTHRLRIWSVCSSASIARSLDVNLFFS